MSMRAPHQPSDTPASPQPALHEPWLVTEAAGVHVGITASFVAEIKMSERCFPIPGMPNHVLGMGTWRGRILPLVDIASALDLAETADRRERLLSRMAEGTLRVVVIVDDELLVGLVADHINGVVRVDPDGPRPATSAPGMLAPLSPKELTYRDSIAFLVDARRLLDAARPR
jgi:chemotaxis signal transduction protein